MNPVATQDQVSVALADFIAKVCEIDLNGTSPKIVISQINQVALPTGNCAVITPLFQVDMTSKAKESHNSVAGTPYVFSTDYVMPTKGTYQIDFYGDNAADNCRAFKIMYRSSYAAEQMTGVASPLDCDNGVQAPFVSGEKQWVSRWTLTVHLQYNVAVSITDEQFNICGDVNTIAADYIN